MSEERSFSSAFSALRSSLTLPTFPQPTRFAPPTLPALVTLLLIVGMAYAGSLRNGFAFDDVVMIEQNALITRLDYLSGLLTMDYWAGRRAPSETVPWTSGLYRPLVLVTYALNYAIGGLRPVGYHLVNVGIHGLVTWLVYLIALRSALGSSSAFVAAAIFAAHPLHTEAVMAVVGRAELLMAAGVLGAVWAATRGRALLSAALFAVALLSKEQAVVLPVIVLLYDLCFPGELSAKRILARFGGHVFVLALYLAIRSRVLGDLYSVPVLFLDNPLAHLSGDLRAYNAMKVAGRYLWLCLWPARLSADYSYNAIPLAESPWEPGVFFGVLGWVALLGIGGWSYFKGSRRACFAVGLTAASFLPASNLILPIGTIMAERLFYLPSAGLCLLAGLAYEWLLRADVANARSRSRLRLSERTLLNLNLSLNLVRRVLVVAFCLVMMARTAMRGRDWASTETLMQSALQVVPASAKVQAVLGGVALTREEWHTALEHFQAAMGLYPDYVRREVTINLNLGMALMKSGRTSEALRAFESAVALDPLSSVTRLSLSRVLFELGRYEEALGEADAALQLRDDLPQAHAARALALRAMGRADEAEVESRRAGGGDTVPGLMGRKTR